MTIYAEVRGGPKERGPSLRDLALLLYRHSRAALGDAPETEIIATALEASAAAHPHAAPVVPGTVVRVRRANRYGNYPPMRLFYCVAGADVHFLQIEHYDEMEP